MTRAELVRLTTRLGEATKEQVRELVALALALYDDKDRTEADEGVTGAYDNPYIAARYLNAISSDPTRKEPVDIYAVRYRTHKGVAYVLMEVPPGFRPVVPRQLNPSNRKDWLRALRYQW